MAESGLRNKLLFTGTVAALVGAGVVIAKAKGETPDQVECNKNAFGNTTLKIENISVRPEGVNFFVFDVPYKNNSCIGQDVAIIMQVRGLNNEVQQLQSRELFIGPGKTEFFAWRVIIPSAVRKEGGNKIQFFVWRSKENPTALALEKIIFV